MVRIDFAGNGTAMEPIIFQPGNTARESDDSDSPETEIDSALVNFSQYAGPFMRVSTATYRFAYVNALETDVGNSVVFLKSGTMSGILQKGDFDRVTSVLIQSGDIKKIPSYELFYKPSR